MPTILLETFIHAPVERCFDLSLDVDAHQKAFGHTGERAVDGVTSGVMKPGDSVTWEGRHFGVQQRLTSRITGYERPNYFVDEMVRGAFKSFKHAHTFAARDGGTLMEDVFEFNAPLGVLGKMAEVLFLTGYMRRLLTRRNEFLKRMAEEG